MDGSKVIIIGAGIAGLSAGCYLQMNGFNTEIFEMGSTPGGLMTSWKRKGYTIDGCIHGLVGSSPSHPLYKMWNEIIDMDEIEFFNSDTIAVFLNGFDENFTEYSNLDKLEEYMKYISPEDSEIIEEFINGVRDFQKFEAFEMMIKPKELYNIGDYLKMLKLFPMLKPMKKWLELSAGEFSEKFRNQYLKKVVQHFMSPILFEMLVLSEMDQKRSGYPRGGSLEFSKKFEKKYLELGGKIHYKSKAIKIITISSNKKNKDSVKGIILEDGTEFYSDIVIGAIDGNKTIYDLLDGKYVYKKLLSSYESLELNPSFVYISLGINDELKNWAPTNVIILDTPLKMPDGAKFDDIKVRVFNFDPSLSPKGKTVITVELPTRNYDFWANLRQNDKQQYNRVKTEVADKVVELLNKYFDGLKEKVEMVDVATPATFKRYTDNYNGSAQGWANENIFKNKPIKKELPNLKNFFMIGHWVIPGGGVPNAFLSGRDVAQIICKQKNIKFLTVKNK